MSKVMTMKEAISKFVKSGDTLFLSGMLHGEPSAAIHEIVRQKIGHLTLVCPLVQTIFFLLGEGLVDKMISGHTHQLNDKDYYSIRKAIAMNRFPVLEEYSHFGLSLALLAGQIGIPYIPAKVQIGSDMLKYNENIKLAECPFTGEKVGVIRAIVPDTGIIHVQRADAEGNAQKWGSLGADQEGINASKTVIVTTEKIVDSDVIRRDPNRTIIPGFRVSAVVEQPFGAFPLHLAGCYDGDSLRLLPDAARDQKSYQAYVKNLIYGVNDWNEYLQKQREILGEEYFNALRIEHPLLSEPVVFGYQ